jgi:hypothetical protein
MNGSAAEEHSPADYDQHDCEDTPQPELRNVLRTDGSKVSAY